MSDFFRNVGEYWAQDNAEFEKGNPRVIDRVARTLSPATSVGSALGSAHAAAGRGDLAGVGLSGLEAVPLFGALKTVAVGGRGLTKAAMQAVPDWQKFLSMMAASAGLGVANDNEAALVEQLQSFGAPRK